MPPREMPPRKVSIAVPMDASPESPSRKLSTSRKVSIAGAGRKMSQAERRLSVYSSEIFSRLIEALSTVQRFDDKKRLAHGFRTWLFATNQLFREDREARERRCVAALRGSRAGRRSLREVDAIAGWFTREVPGLSRIASDACDAVAQDARLVELRRGECLFVQDQRAHDFFAVCRASSRSGATSHGAETGRFDDGRGRGSAAR